MVGGLEENEFGSDFLVMTSSRFIFSQGRSKPWVRSISTNGFGFKCSVSVEKREECGVLSVDKVMEISRRVSDEPRVGNITLEL